MASVRNPTVQQREEHEEQRAVADDRLHRVARREALAEGVDDRLVDLGTRSADGDLHDGVDEPATDAGDGEEDRRASDRRAGRSTARGCPIANSRKIGLPRNEIDVEHRDDAVLVVEALVEPRAPRLVERRQRPVGGHLVQQQAERDADERQHQREQQDTDLVAPERPELGGDAFGQQVLHRRNRSSRAAANPSASAPSWRWGAGDAGVVGAEAPPPARRGAACSPRAPAGRRRSRRRRPAAADRRATGSMIVLASALLVHGAGRRPTGPARRRRSAGGRTDGRRTTRRTSSRPSSSARATTGRTRSGRSGSSRSTPSHTRTDWPSTSTCNGSMRRQLRARAPRAAPATCRGDARAAHACVDDLGVATEA